MIVHVALTAGWVAIGVVCTVSLRRDLTRAARRMAEWEAPK